MIPRKWRYVAVLLPPVLVSLVFNGWKDRKTADPQPPEWKASVFVPDSLPKKTKLATMQWAPPPEVGDEARRDFERDGYVVLRQAIDPVALEVLRNTSENICSDVLERKGWCHLKQTRWQVDEFRDFLLHGTLGTVCNAFVQKGGIRVLQDGVFGMKYREPAGAERIVSEELHVDDNGAKGIYGDFHTSTAGVTVWIPMHDIDFDRDGGGVSLVPRFLHHECRSVKNYWKHFGKTTNRTDEDCLKELEASLIHVGPLKQGDVLLWHPWVMHRTDPVRRPDFRRFSWFGWCVESEAVSCRPDFCDSRSAMPCCRDAAQQVGAKLDHPCFPQIYPFTPQHEIDAHFEQRPKPLIGRDRVSKSRVPYSCET